MNDLQLAQEAALKAGQFLTAQNLSQREIKEEFLFDVKLAADVETEKLVRQFLTEHSPYPILGEEEGGNLQWWESDQAFWVLDPLDGTYNYMRNWPICCVSIGLIKNKKPLVGVIYDFNCNEMFSASPKAGFSINNVRQEPHWEKEVNRACLISGFSRADDFDSAYWQRKKKIWSQFRKLRMLGSAAMSLAYVASGRADAYTEEQIYLWDVAAGWALIEAAGGKVRHSPLTEEFYFDFMAAPDLTWFN